jgi:hypothetical protein
VYLYISLRLLLKVARFREASKYDSPAGSITHREDFSLKWLEHFQKRMLPINVRLFGWKCVSLPIDMLEFELSENNFELLCLPPHAALIIPTSGKY